MVPWITRSLVTSSSKPSSLTTGRFSLSLLIALVSFMSCRKCPAQFPAMQEKGYCSPLGELDLQHRGVATAAVADQPKRFSVEVDPIRPQLLVAGWAADRRHPNDADAGEQEAEFSIAVA